MPVSSDKIEQVLAACKKAWNASNMAGDIGLEPNRARHQGLTPEEIAEAEGRAENARTAAKDFADGAFAAAGIPEGAAPASMPAGTVLVPSGPTDTGARITLGDDGVWRTDNGRGRPLPESVIRERLSGEPFHSGHMIPIAP